MKSENVKLGFSIAWTVVKQAVREVKTRYVAARDSERLRAVNREGINSALAYRKNEQDLCKHRQHDGSYAVTVLQETICGEPAAICVKCQKIIKSSEDLSLYNDIAKFKGFGGWPNPKPIPPELLPLYEMPLAELRKQIEATASVPPAPLIAVEPKPARKKAARKVTRRRK